ncbi:HipA N-terminal domain-containing protein [Treponema zuelzerae]|uniref:HipA N-terminal domain-containing protein n=1 Tax=Teretinema zuelzerae TaxID=156 RepID=A0AAE3EHV6_9SPIR|nr:HipA N-terminal domain-containing protein [Teretinema zuelzerae]MCD1654093.1 HipA N-terminal domain-containing protein [Teretinema zuelzerae]
MNRRGIIWRENKPAATITETDEGYEFAYLDSWLADPAARPISLTLPLSAEPVISKTFIPFLDGLIPEGWLLDISVHNWKLDPRDRMGLLLAVCRDCIGNISVTPGDPQ